VFGKVKQRIKKGFTVIPVYLHRVIGDHASTVLYHNLGSYYGKIMPLG
jgi:hypothetical protein